MTVRPVLRYPHPVLKEVASPVGPPGEEHRKLGEDLVDTMQAGPATVGLAAPQIGTSVRAFCLDVSAHRRATTSHGLLVLFDPELVETGGQAVMREGCLSVPDLTANVRRAETLVVRAVDTLGGTVVYRMEGFEARALQHELDHLDGTLILDRVDSARDVFPRKVYR